MDQQQTATEDATSSHVNDAKVQAEEALHGLEAYLAPLFAKLPHLPEGFHKFIIAVAPWVALVFGIIGVLTLLSLGGFGVLLSMATFGLALPVLVHILIGLLGAALLLMSFPGLKALHKRGWNLAFYSLIVNIVGSIVGFFMGGMINLVSLVIGALIGFYILFEVRSYYK